jgi:hypothetical protein
LPRAPFYIHTPLAVIKDAFDFHVTIVCETAQIDNTLSTSEQRYSFRFNKARKLKYAYRKHDDSLNNFQLDPFTLVPLIINKYFTNMQPPYTHAVLSAEAATIIRLSTHHLKALYTRRPFAQTFRRSN